jgi:hypothetical protein
MSWWLRVTNVFRFNRLDQDLDDEQRFHVEARAEELTTNENPVYLDTRLDWRPEITEAEDAELTAYETTDLKNGATELTKKTDL